MTFQYLASSPQQCDVTSDPKRQGDLGQPQHPSGSPCILLIILDPLQLLPLPQAEDNPKGEKDFKTPQRNN